jgi:SAM-dependent MidA family methyltransferase
LFSLLCGQHELLRDLGIQKRTEAMLDKLYAEKKDKEAHQLVEQVDRLISPHKMGLHFKAMCVMRKEHGVPICFAEEEQDESSS